MPQSARTHHDGCALILFADKRGRSTHANITRAIEGLRSMGHRSGGIDGEGDGCGLQVDIPRELWAQRLEQASLSPHLSESNHFAVGHFLLPGRGMAREADILDRARKLFQEHQVQILVERLGGTRNEELGPRARLEAPLFWQVAALCPVDTIGARQRLFLLQIALETTIPELHAASLSMDCVIYKLRGMPELLPRVYPDLLDPALRSVVTLGHSRYSTNTLPSVDRAQPFSLIGHNGEINTIERLRTAARLLDIEPVPGGSDSQDLNRILEGLINIHGLSPLEALEILFPPVDTETDRFPDGLRRMYEYYRWFFPASVQGPVALVARFGEVCMGGVDAMGLRPLWFGESDYEYFLSSEKGVVDIRRTMDDPRPLAPGEKIAILAGPGRRAEVLDHSAIQARVCSLFEDRRDSLGLRGSLYREIPAESAMVLPEHAPPVHTMVPPLSDGTLAAYGWTAYDMSMRRRTAVEGRPPIGSLGYQGPLAPLALESLPNVADFFKENVAVVTNPAIDREREREHFSTRTIIGDRPDIDRSRTPSPVGLVLKRPLLLSSHDFEGMLSAQAAQSLIREAGGFLLEEVLSFFTAQSKDPGRAAVIASTFDLGQGIASRLESICSEALNAVRRGAVLLVLDDSTSFDGERCFIDPALVAAAVSTCLERRGVRRRTSLVLRSGAIRNLHDIMLLLGLGADALCPFLLWRSACADLPPDVTPGQALSRTMEVIGSGMERVMSAMGIHELCGYGRIFSAIGLGPEIEKLLGCKTFCPTPTGLGYTLLETMASERLRRSSQGSEVVFESLPPRNVRVGKILRRAATGRMTPGEMSRELAEVERERPIAIRHLLEFVLAQNPLSPGEVDISVGSHELPLLIAAMSFGSQGENSFRAYARAGFLANTICINGEGGEIPDMLGAYRANRCQQIASGRFGVDMELLNSADYLEIKIGQGAKPGEGGHLPGVKVTGMVARARRCRPGTTLISPSNQHDIYSIEDLHQIVTELKTAHPRARISVKIPVTADIGAIAVGVAKAGADIVNVSGFEGGTGAAREHAKKFVGLPVEIGVREAHSALVESGMRPLVEIWCDGGLRSGRDVLKLVLLGADRAAVGTAALMAIGCISCERCHLDRCPRGISTQLTTREQAEARGIKGFQPRETETEAVNLARLLRCYGEEIREFLALMGQRRLADVVGRTDLLFQSRHREVLDAGRLLDPVTGPPFHATGSTPLLVRKPLNHLTRMVSDLAMERFARGDGRIVYTDQGVRSTDRALGTYLAGSMVRESTVTGSAMLRLDQSVPGNGLCAFNVAGLETVVHGGTQDGAAKGSSGGSLCVLKGTNLLARRIDGSVGKSFGYGATGGLLMVQNLADSRACVRLSGADAVFGGRITRQVRDHEPNLASRAHLKGFAFEYMTGGRVVVLGDPGPWICSGMTGGIVYQCLSPEHGFDRQGLSRRLAGGANVEILDLDGQGISDLLELLPPYVVALRASFQEEEASAVGTLLTQARERFVMIRPKPVDLPQE
jgi:glutamate synthase (NADPH) large chain